MEDDVIVVHEVARRLVLRLGDEVVGLWNDAFDVDGVPPVDGTTVSGVKRVLRSDGHE
jgi:type IV secretion system protein VirB9